MPSGHRISLSDFFLPTNRNTGRVNQVVEVLTSNKFPSSTIPKASHSSLFPGKLISDWCSSFYDDIPPSFPLDPNSPLPAAGPTGCELIRAPFTQSQSGDSILNKSALLLPVIVLLTSNSPFRAAPYVTPFLRPCLRSPRFQRTYI